MPIYGNLAGNGGNIPAQAENADTLDGKHADEFAAASDMEELKIQVGDTPVSEQIASAAAANLLEIQKHGRVQNLLYNSNFGNPHNSRGATSYTGTVYTIDRWRGSDSIVVTLVDGGITLSFDSTTTETRSLRQPISNGMITDGVYTGAVCVDGIVYTYQTTATSGQLVKGDNTNFADGSGYFRAQYESSVGMNCFYIFCKAGSTTGVIEWAALYEGAYTADTLPIYVPEDYNILTRIIYSASEPTNPVDGQIWLKPV